MSLTNAGAVIGAPLALRRAVYSGASAPLVRPDLRPLCRDSRAHLPCVHALWPRGRRTGRAGLHFLPAKLGTSAFFVNLLGTAYELDLKTYAASRSIPRKARPWASASGMLAESST
jgi:hypothetical protein